MDFITAVFAIMLGIIAVVAAVGLVILVGVYLIIGVFWLLAAGINALFKGGS